MFKMSILQRTPLYDAHLSAGARLVEFGGWEMPVEYKGLLAEHETVRRHAGLFDVSHMGQIFVSGPDAEAFLRYLLPNDVAGMQIGDMRYSTMCREDGGIIDDLMVNKLDEQRYLLVVNAATCQSDWEWIQQHGSSFAACELINRSHEFAMIALQGPEAERILQPMLADKLSQMDYMRMVETSVDGAPVFLSRSGYTGEDGFELICRAEDAAELWQSLIDAGAEPIGLGARDTLRLEMGYSLYGNDIDSTTTPLDASLGWTVKLKGDRSFVGAEALREQKANEADGQSGRRLVGLVVQGRGIPRHGQKILDGDTVIGEITSGTFSPSRKQGIALGYVQSSHRKPGTTLVIEVRKRKLTAEVTRPPFVPSHTKTSS